MTVADIADKANDESQRDIDNALENAKLPEPNEITHCIDCGIKIETKRKVAVPHATRCIACQNVLELAIREYNR